MSVIVKRTIRGEAWCVVVLSVIAMVILEVTALNGPNVCMVKQKYNITKRVKYRAPMSVRTYEWCFSMPPRCSKWNTEMRDLTRLETEERTAEVAVCCPGYKMRDVSCVPICPNGKTGRGCSEDCPDNKWGPNCIHDCQRCKNGFCSPLTGECECLDGWQGESCDTSMPPTISTTSLEELLTTLTTKTSTFKTTPKMTTTSTVASTVASAVAKTVTVADAPTVLVTVPTSIKLDKISTSPSTTKLTAPQATVASTSTTTTMATTTVTSTTGMLITTERKVEMTKPTVATTEITKLPTTSNITKLIMTSTLKSSTAADDIKVQIFFKPLSTTTEATDVNKLTEPRIAIKVIQNMNKEQEQEEVVTLTETPKPIITSTSQKEIIYKTETTRKEIISKGNPTTPKFKPKEIWIRPAQKSESPMVETKIKMNYDIPRYRSANNREVMPTSTTPKTIIVSIIPTSVSYSTFKKIALTASYLSSKNSTTKKSYNKTDYGLTTTPMLAATLKPLTKLSTSTKKALFPIANDTSTKIPLSTSVTSKVTIVTPETMPLGIFATTLPINKTNSMVTENNKGTSISVTATSINILHTTQKWNDLLTNLTNNYLKISTTIHPTTERTTQHFEKQATFRKNENTSSVTKQYKTTNLPKVFEKNITTVNATNNHIKVTTDDPIDDEEFHILTEPEHITAVMGDKGTERSSVDLISVISIAGGVMMAVIAVAVVIVMIERCKKPRYEDVRKINDIRMQVMIDNNDVPPPYVRSIFHTPLPEPPASEKCHYQPISTLDRNLKQFMRPVVVQTISPIMLENFRGILECHYDHLPRRSNDFGTIQTQSSAAPSINDCNELRQLRASVTESAIEAMKCEAKLDVIDSTTSEPLYAEIPCWRPPSEHAIEILNMNGEA
ncbi:unnamed protein product, partial [Arctia plantaginis]